ncbi:conjugal transfer protein TraG, partial [Finegoldia magna ALB8]
FFYIGNIFSKHINSYVGGDIIDRIMVGISDIGTLSYIPSFNPRDLLVGISVAGLVKLIVYSKGKIKRNIGKVKSMDLQDGEKVRILLHILILSLKTMY